MKEKQFIQIQLALFFKSDFVGMPENASLSIKEQFGNDLNAQIIGMPNNAPSEIPRVVINSPLVNVNLAKNRIDFFSKQENFIKDNFDKIWNIVNSLSVEIGRVGIVLTYFKEAETEEMKKIFDQSKISLLNPKDITFRFNEEIKIGEFISNNSQMYASGFGDDGRGGKKRGIIITRDINTLQEDMNKNKFDKEILNAFILSSIIKAETTIF